MMPKCVLLCAGAAAIVSGIELSKKKKHHKKHHRHAQVATTVAAPADSQAAVTVAPVAPVAAATPAVVTVAGTPAAGAMVAPPAVVPDKTAVVADLNKLAATMDTPAAPAAATGLVNASLQIAGPVTPDFPALFSHEAALALSKAGLQTDAAAIKVTATKQVDAGLGSQVQILEVEFSAPAEVAHQIKVQAATESSPLATGGLEKFLSLEAPTDAGQPPAAPAADQALEIDGEVPFGTLEPFGREDTANELTEQSIKESDAMVDQMERAEVAEEKRSVFRALTRLRGAAITSFDGVARSQTGNIDEYNHKNQWRAKHPLKHLAQEEADSSKWAFPSH